MALFMTIYFMNITTKQLSYALGFSWADGYLFKNTSLRIECIKEDLEEIKDLFSSCGNFKIYYRNRKNRKEQMRLEINNKTFCTFLQNHGYNNKSNISPFSILEKIPEELRKYFFRGIVDGDGCFYINKKQYLYQFSIGSTYEQDWSYMELLFNSLNIKYSIHRRIHKKSKSSIIRITNKKDICTFCKYIYENSFPEKNYESNFIGLSRKRDKAEKMFID